MSATELQQQALDQVRVWAEQAVATAQVMGVVLTIEQRSIPPLAMGRYETIVSVRPAREAS